MFIAFDRIGRFKRWVIGGIIGFFRGIKNAIVRAIRGPRGGAGNGNAGADIIALEVTDEKDFQVRTIQVTKTSIMLSFFLDTSLSMLIERNI